MKDREVGLYRTLLFRSRQTPAFLSLSLAARVVHDELIFRLPLSGIGIVYGSEMVERCGPGATTEIVATAREELIAAGLLVVEGLGWWLVDRLDDEANQRWWDWKHRAGVQKQLASMPPGELAGQFRRRYPLWMLDARPVEGSAIDKQIRPLLDAKASESDMLAALLPSIGKVSPIEVSPKTLPRDSRETSERLPAVLSEVKANSNGLTPATGETRERLGRDSGVSSESLGRPSVSVSASVSVSEAVRDPKTTSSSSPSSARDARAHEAPPKGVRPARGEEGVSATASVAVADAPIGLLAAIDDDDPARPWRQTCAAKADIAAWVGDPADPVRRDALDAFMALFLMPEHRGGGITAWASILSTFLPNGVMLAGIGQTLTPDELTSVLLDYVANESFPPNGSYFRKYVTRCVGAREANARRSATGAMPASATGAVPPPLRTTTRNGKQLLPIQIAGAEAGARLKVL